MQTYRVAVPLLITIFAIFGAIQGLVLHNNAASYVVQAIHTVITGGILLFWADRDSRSNHKTVSNLQAICLFVFGFFAMPFYLAKARAPGSWPFWLMKGIIILAVLIGAFLGAAALFEGRVGN